MKSYESKDIERYILHEKLQNYLFYSIIGLASVAVFFLALTLAASL